MNAEFERLDNGQYKCSACAATYKYFGSFLNHWDKEHRFIPALAKPLWPPEPKPTCYDAVIFCTNCCRLERTGMPVGVLVDDVTHSICGVAGTIKLVVDPPKWL